MKKAFFTLLFFCFALSLFSQGISIQGIARDNNDSAITDTNLTFTFSITEDNNTVVFAETQSIKTDNFGVFSHIISTGNPNTNTFNDIDFSVQELKVKVLINYNSNDITVYDQPLQYTPYAHYSKRATKADNGVPTGAVMPYMGNENTVPEGWLLCNGDDITIINETKNLRDLLGSSKTPDLRGVFLRGSGNLGGDNFYVGPSLGDIQLDTQREHDHGVGTIQIATNSGTHQHIHRFNLDKGTSVLTGFGNNDGAPERYGYDGSDGQTAISTEKKANDSFYQGGEHKHPITGKTAKFGTTENRPINVGVNYIIKL
jgi:hypothetical protein